LRDASPSRSGSEASDRCMKAGSSATGCRWDPPRRHSCSRIWTARRCRWTTSADIPCCSSSRIRLRPL
jgi:hypothetical protein